MTWQIWFQEFSVGLPKPIGFLLFVTTVAQSPRGQKKYPGGPLAARYDMS